MHKLSCSEKQLGEVKQKYKNNTETNSIFSAVGFYVKNNRYCESDWKRIQTY